MSGAAPTREVAYRVFADEFAEATFSYAESDDERAPQYLVTPTGARINRLFVVGVLTETEEVSDGVLRARIVDPTGAFVLYAGQYQPEALAFFERADPPLFVSLTGKARTFEPEGADRVLTSLRPEQVNEVDSDTRDSWVVQTALHTLERTGLLAQALDLEARGEDLSVRLTAAGVEPGLAAGIPRAIREYEPTTGYLEAVQQLALDAVRVVAGELEEVSGGAGSPSDGGTGEVLTGFTEVTLVSESTESDEPEPTEKPDEPVPGTSRDIDSAENETNPPAEPTQTPGETASDEAPTETDEELTESEDADGETVNEPSAKVEAEADTAEETGESEEAGSETGAEQGEAEGNGKATAEPTETDELYELSEEERAEVEENYDVGFESGADIGSPEETESIEPEAGTPATVAETAEDGNEPTSGDVPVDASTGEQPDTAAEPTSNGDTEAGETDEADADEETIDTVNADSTEPETETGDLSADEQQDLVVETLQELGDGAGVPRSELVKTLQDRHGLDEGEIEEAIEAALLGGRCFESGAEDLKPI